MKKFVSICLVCAMSLSMLTSCGKPNLEGEWELCNASGREIGFSVDFNDSGKVKLEDEKFGYEVIDKDTIEIDGEEYDFEIIDKDKKLIYLGELSDKKEVQALNTAAAELYKASNTAIIELDEEGVSCGGKAIICSDKTKSINADYESDFISKVGTYFEDVSRYGYIIFIDDYLCTYTAVIDSSNKEIVRMYPRGESQFEGMTFDEIYEEMKKMVESEVPEETESDEGETEESEEDSEVSEKMSVDEHAEYLYKAANTVVVELEEEDRYYDKAIICSDSSKSINPIPEGKSEDFNFIDEIKNFFGDVDSNGYEYLIFMDEGYCKYTAVVDPSNEEVVGVYEKDGRFDGMTFDEIYEKIKNVVENKEVFEEIESTTEETEESEEDSEVSEKMEINEYVEYLYKAANSALVDIDELGIYYEGKAIICSDSSKNINAIPSNADEDFNFAERVQRFFDNINDYEYIMFIEDESCKCTVAIDPSNEEVVGVYDKDGKFDGMTFDEIYEEMKNSIE